MKNHQRVLLLRFFFLFYDRDFDPNETLKDKLHRLGEVKDCRGLGKLLKQMAVATAKAPGKQPHQFLGRVNIPLKVNQFSF